jgi:hypothetical protein
MQRRRTDRAIGLTEALLLYVAAFCAFGCAMQVGC